MKLRRERMLVLGSILVMFAGCGGGRLLGAKALLQQAKSLQSEAAEGALLAQDTAAGRTTIIYTREQSSVLAKAASLIELSLSRATTVPAIEPDLRRLAELAGRVRADLGRIGNASADEERALARDLQAAAQASQKIGQAFG
ncbi:MAG: hypothetical protein ABI828_06440 [Actinomycetota bacterium]